MRRYKMSLTLFGLALTLTQGVGASTTAFEKAVQRNDVTTQSPETAAATRNGVPTWLVGTWVLVRYDNVYPDGRLVELYGPNPQGLWIVDAQGHFMMQVVRAEREPEVDWASAPDMNAHYGWVSVDGAQLHTHTAHASYPNGDGRDGEMPYALQGTQLTYSVAKPANDTSEGPQGVVVWRRLTN
jgi:hypothetical protein